MSYRASLDKPYTASHGHDNKYYINGPAPGGERSYYGGTLYPNLRFDTVEEAERAAKLANIAFEQGKAAMRNEIKALLDVCAHLLRSVCNFNAGVHQQMVMMFGTHPLTIEGFRARTAADARDVPMTAYSYKCRVCGKFWNFGTMGRKKAAEGGWKCPDCVK